jgi:acyl dehydratase
MQTGRRGVSVRSLRVEEVAVELGIRHGPFPGTLDPEAIAAYAAATGDTTPAVREGRAVPATFPVVLVFDAQQAANGDLPAAVYEQARTGVHGEHDVVLHRPLAPGETIETWSEVAGVRRTRAGTLVVLHMDQYDAGGALVAEQWWTTLFLGTGVLAEAGAEPPDHTFPDGARQRPVGSATQHIDAEAARRYAEVSGDWSAHHFDLDAARAAGVDYLFAHGLCTMAMCTQRAVRLVAGGDPGRVRRVAVRFASPAPLGEDLTVDVFAAGPSAYAFEATCGEATVVKHGRLELRTAT